jgi:hypothetical protein
MEDSCPDEDNRGDLREKHGESCGEEGRRSGVASSSLRMASVVSRLILFCERVRDGSLGAMLV